MCFRTLTAVLLAVLMLPASAGAISVAEENKLGRRFALEAAGQLPTIKDPAVVDLVRNMGGRLVEGLGAQPFDYHFEVVAQLRPEVEVPGARLDTLPLRALREAARRPHADPDTTLRKPAELEPPLIVHVVLLEHPGIRAVGPTGLPVGVTGVEAAVHAPAAYCAREMARKEGGKTAAPGAA